MKTRSVNHKLTLLHSLETFNVMLTQKFCYVIFAVILVWVSEGHHSYKKIKIKREKKGKKKTLKYQDLFKALNKQNYALRMTF